MQRQGIVMKLVTFIMDLKSRSVLGIHMQTRKVTAVLALTALAIMVFAALSPMYSSGFNSTYGNYYRAKCTVTYTGNGVTQTTFSPGTTITVTVTTNCIAIWKYSLSTGMTVLAHGLVICLDQRGCTKTLTYQTGSSSSSSPLVLGPGSYTFTVKLDELTFKKSMQVLYWTVTPEFPAGLILGVVAPFAALFGYVKLRKASLKF